MEPIQDFPFKVCVDTGAFCEYHQRYHHETKDCHALKRQILELMSEGKVRLTRREGYQHEKHFMKVHSNETCA